MPTTRAPHRRIFAFSLVEVVVCIAIVAITTLITFGIVMRAKDGAKDTLVVSNLKQIGVSHFLYAQDHDDGLPSIVPVSGGVPSSYNQGDRIEDIPMATFKGDAKGWKGLLIPYGPESGMFYSPADPYARSNHELFGTSGPYNSADSSVTYCMGAVIPSSVHQGLVFWRLSRAEEWNGGGIRPFLVTNIFEPAGQRNSITVHRLGRRVPAWYLEGNSKMIDAKQANPAYN